jgi:hypothetical protein
MQSGAIVRVFCVDGPCRGVTYVDLDTGHVLFSDVADAERCVYRICDGEMIDTIAGRYPAAYFDRFDWARRPGRASSSGR